MGRVVAAVGVIALIGCGRLRFDDDRASDAALIDESTDAADPCPNGYVFVPGNATLGSSDFCAMRFEARARDGSGTVVATGCVELPDDCVPNGLPVDMHDAVSVPEGLPWRGLDALSAYAACESLGAGYALMTNTEWMTIARAAEIAAANWSGGAPYDGRLVEGNTDGSGLAAVSDPSDPYSDTGNSSDDPADMGWEQRRTIVLPAGGELWDLPGNMQEWIDWTYGDESYAGAPPCTGGELTAITCAGYAPDDYNSASGTLDSFVGAGYVIGGSGNTARRGGQGSDRSNRLAGIYALNMNRFDDQTFPATGFRCVYRLP